MKFYNIFFLFSFLFCLNFEVRGQTQVIPSLEASAGNLATAGAIPYVSSAGVLNINAAKLFWDNANARLGIGTNAPSKLLELKSASDVRFVLNSTVSTAYAGTNFYYNGGDRGGLFYRESDGFQQLWTGTSAYFIRQVWTNTGVVGIGTSNTSPTGTLHVYDATASTGVTTLTVKAGAGQNTTNLQEWQNSSGTVLASVASNGQIEIAATANLKLADGQAVVWGTGAGGTDFQIGNGSSHKLQWYTNSALRMTLASDGALQLGNATDTSLSRISAGVVGVGTGVAGSTDGTIQAAKYIGALTTPASAAAACTAGTFVFDTGFFYGCTATNTWKRVAIATW